MQKRFYENMIFRKWELRIKDSNNGRFEMNAQPTVVAA